MKMLSGGPADGKLCDVEGEVAWVALVDGSPIVYLPGTDQTEHDWALYLNQPGRPDDVMDYVPGGWRLLR